MKHLLSIIGLLLLFSRGTLFAFEPFAGEKSDYHGAVLYKVKIKNGVALVLCPDKPLNGNPWVLAPSLYNLSSGPVANITRTELELVKHGFHVVAFGLGNTFGAPDSIAQWDVVYDEMTTRHGLAQRMAMLGLSREGLSITRWAARHPGRVSSLYMDKAVCDFKSWPGGKLGISRGSPRDWAALLPLYGFKTEAEALAYNGNPVDLAAKLAADHVAIIYITGDTDDVVPYRENGARMEQEYQKAGGIFQLIRRAEGHHPHGLSDPTPVVQFIVRHSSGS